VTSYCECGAESSGSCATDLGSYLVSNRLICVIDYSTLKIYIKYDILLLTVLILKASNSNT
jgi:hypothetical protein